MFETTTEVQECGEVVVVYGQPGIGKSTVLAQATKEAGDKGLWVSVVENGLSTLQKDDSIADLKGINQLPTPVTKWTDADNGGLLELFRWLCHPEQLAKYDVIALDSLNLIKDDLEAYCFKKFFIDSSEFAGMSEDDVKSRAYQFGAANLIAHEGSEWAKVIAALRYLKAKGKRVFISSHHMVGKARSVNDELEYSIIQLDFPSTKKVDLGEMLVKEADYVVYGKKDVTVAKAKGNKVRVMGGDRVFVTQATPTITAKFRGSAPEQIELSYEELKKYLG